MTAAFLAILAIVLHASLPVLLGSMTGAVVGGLLSSHRSWSMTVGGMCGGVLAILLFIRAWYSLA
jgi:hypothetical protein